MRKIILLLLIVPFLCNAQVGVFRDFVVNASVKQAEAVVPTANLVSYYNFEGNGDDSNGGNDGTVVNAIFNASGKVGQSIDLDGNSDYNQIPDNASLSFTTGSPDGAFSIGGWYKFDNTTDSSILISKRSGGGHEYQLGWDTTGYIVFVCFSQGGTSAYLDGRVTSWTPSLDTWYHIYATYDGSGNESGMSIYIDKVSQTVTDNTTGTYVEMNNTTAPVYLGIYGPIPTNTASHDGEQDMIGIWNKELTQGEINAIYTVENSGVSVTDQIILDLNPVVWWDDEDISGTSDGDAVTSWTDRILSKTVNQKGTGNPILELIGGERAVEFSGANAFSMAEFAEIDFAYTDPLTIVVQMGAVIDNTGTLVGKQDDATNPVHYQVQRNSTLTNGVGVNLNASSNTSTDNYFNHTTATAWTAGDVVTMVADGSALGVEVYQNGTLITQTTTPDVGRGTATQNDDLHFGARGAGGGTLGYQYTGSISNVLIFDYELTPTQIQTVVDNL